MGAATATEVSFALVCVADKAHKKKTLTRVSWRQSKTTCAYSIEPKMS